MAEDWSDFASSPLVQDALERWAARVTLPRQAFYALEAHGRAQAFTASFLWSEHALADARESLTRALAEGKTVRQWRTDEWKALADKFGRRSADASWYVDTVFRTNVQAAYAGGRYAEMFSATELEASPYWLYAAVDDDRTRPEHRALDGKVFRKDDPDARRYLPPLGFNCLPGGSLVRGVFDGASRAVYSGQLVQLKTARGNRLTVTRNHPVGTSRGLVPAHELREGDRLLCYPGRVEDRLDSVRASEAVRPIFRANEPEAAPARQHVQDRPSKISETFEALRLLGRLVLVPVGVNDLHGDASSIEGDVQVVALNRELLVDVEPSLADRFGNFLLVAMHETKTLVSCLRSAPHALGRVLAAAACTPGGPTLALDGIAVARSPLQALRSGSTSAGNPRFLEALGDAAPRDAEPLRDRVLRFPTVVALDDVVGVELKSVVGLPVFDLQSPHGWILAGNIYVSNCRCQAIQLAEEDVQAGGYKVTPGHQIAALPLEGGGFVGPPPEGWDTDRVRALVPSGLVAAPKAQYPTPAPPAPPAAAPPPPAPPAPALPPPAPAPAPSPAGGPKGPAVSSKVGTISPSFRTEAKRVLALIDSIHGDGALVKTNLAHLAGDGGFWRPGKIKVGKGALHPALQLSHEIGHWLDYEGVSGWKGRSATGDAVMRDVMGAIDRSAAAAALKSRNRSNYVRYLLKPTELWARAYSQYVAEASGDPALLAQVELWRKGKLRGRDPDGQWSSLDFAPIRTEIEKLMRSLGWRT